MIEKEKILAKYIGGKNKFGYKKNKVHQLFIEVKRDQPKICIYKPNQKIKTVCLYKGFRMFLENWVLIK